MPVTLRITLSFLLCSAIGSLQGQTGYVLTTRGDSLTGKINFQKTGRVEQVFVKGESRKTIAATQVVRVGIDNNQFIPVLFGGSVRFMKVEIDGYLSLLAFQPDNLMTYDGRLLRKRDGRIMEVPNIGFKKHMSHFISEDEDLANKISEGTYDRKDLEKIVQEFNQFITKRTIKIKESEPTIEQINTIELISKLQQDVDATDIADKKDVNDMLLDLKNHIAEKRPAPSYLTKALKNKLESNPELMKQLDELLSKL